MAFKAQIHTEPTRDHVDPTHYTARQAFDERVARLRESKFSFDADKVGLRIRYTDHNGDTITIRYEDTA